MSLAAKQQRLIDDLLLIEDSQERLGYVVDRSRKIPPLDASERRPENLVRGCVSQAWLVAEMREGRAHFRSDADSPLVRGLLALLCELYDGGTSAEIVAIEPEVLEKTGLTATLSPTRLNGLRSVRAKIRDFALTYS